MTYQQYVREVKDKQSLDDKLWFMLDTYRQNYYSSHIADYWLEKILSLTITKEYQKFSNLKQMMVRKGMITERSEGQWTITI